MSEDDFVIKKYKKGDEINPISVAGQDLEIWSLYGINAQVFEDEKEIKIPLIDSDSPGTGMIDDFLTELKQKAKDKNVVFVNVINQGLIKHLMMNGINFTADGIIYKYKSVKKNK